MAAFPPEPLFVHPPADQHDVSLPLSNSAAATLLSSPTRVCTLNDENSITTPIPSPAAILMAVPPKISPSILRRRQVPWPTGSRQSPHQSGSVPMEFNSDPAVKCSFSTMEASFAAVEDDNIGHDSTKALVVFQSKKAINQDEFWQVAFQDYKRLKSDIAEGRNSQWLSHIV